MLYFHDWFILSISCSLCASKLHCLWVDSARPSEGPSPGSTASFINQGAAPQPRLSNLAARLRYNYVGLGVERRDRGVGVQLGVDRMGVGVLPSVFPYCGWCSGGGGAVRERGRQKGGSDLSDTSSPSFRTESQYSKLPSADKKKWAWPHMKKIGLSGRGDTLIA